LKSFFVHKRKERAEQAAREEEVEKATAGEKRERKRRRERKERPERTHEARETREAREPREPKPAEAPAAEEAEAPGAKIYVSLGTADEMDEAQIRKTLLDLAKVEEDSVLSVDVKDSFSFFTVEKDAAAAFLSANGAQVGEKELRVELAKGGRRRRRR